MNLFVVLEAPVRFLFYLYLLYHCVTLRENSKKRLLICFAAAFVLQILTRLALLTDTPWIQEYNIAKILTIIMIFMIIFLGGTCVHGGWTQIGLFVIISDTLLAVYERLYWQVWGMITHAGAEEIILRSQMLTFDLAAALEILMQVGMISLLVIPAQKIRKYPFGQYKIVKIVVIVYLVLGSLPTSAKTGFENEYLLPTLLFAIIDAGMLFFAAMTILRKMEHDSTHLLRLRQYAFAAQTEALDAQRQSVRRFRHDVKRHLDAMTYLTKARPELEENPSFLQYRQELERYRDIFRQNTYCDSDELNAGISQIEQYCASRGIRSEIRLRRLTFAGWKKGELLEFGTLLYNLVTAIDKTGIASLHMSGDEVQGQNVLRLEAEYCQDGNGAVSRNKGAGNEMTVRDYYFQEIEKILARRKGSGMKQPAENGWTCALAWTKGE